jgi:hypothetical protein
VYKLSYFVDFVLYIAVHSFRHFHNVPVLMSFGTLCFSHICGLVRLQITLKVPIIYTSIRNLYDHFSEGPWGPFLFVPLHGVCLSYSSRRINISSRAECPQLHNDSCPHTNTRGLAKRLSLQPPPLRGEGWRGGTSHSDPVTTLPAGATARLQSDTPSPEPSLARRRQVRKA